MKNSFQIAEREDFIKGFKRFVNKWSHLHHPEMMGEMFSKFHAFFL